MTKVTLSPGDGIGPEITKAVVQIFKAAGVPIEWESVETGIDEFKRTGILLPEEFKESLKRNKIALKGPTTTPVGGGHRSINVTMRQEFKLYANIRPIKTIEGLPSKFSDVDLITVRENSEDLYKGIEYLVDKHTAHGIKLITYEASYNIGKFAFELAEKWGRKKVTVVHKANIMKFTDGVFLDGVRQAASEHTDISFDEIIVDNCCMQLVTNPQQFDVIVTENLYGDIISDLTAGLIGGLGLASGANIGKDLAVFEAAHGSAPDIAGKGFANPTALLQSGIMLLNHIGLNDYSKKIESALFDVLRSPEKRTKDLGGQCSTDEFTEHLCTYF